MILEKARLHLVDQPKGTVSDLNRLDGFILSLVHHHPLVVTRRGDIRQNGDNSDS